jgi:glycosyltransferase involved in cell wall biosynthesis
MMRKRVLIVVQNLPVPFDRRVWLEATTLARAGWRVSVISPKAKGYDESHETIEDVAVYRYRIPVDAQTKLGFVAEFAWCFLATTWLSLKVALAGRGFDVLHVCNPPETYFPLGWFWRLFGKVFIFDHHDLSPEMYAAKFGTGDGFLMRALLAMERWTFRAAQIVITTNQSHKEIAVARGGKVPDDVYIVRSGPDLKRFTRHGRDRALSKGKPFLLAYLGEICKQDGVDHLVRALKILVRDMGRDDVHCIFVGGGPHQPAIAAYARELGLDDVSTFTGRVSDDDLCRILSSADLGIDPDPKNPWSDKSTMNKVIEYMFFGLPVVAYDLKETRASAGAAGHYATPNDERALAEAIAGLLDDPGARAAMASLGERRVREQLAWDHSAPILIEAYERAARLAAGSASARDAVPVAQAEADQREVGR